MLAEEFFSKRAAFTDKDITQDLSAVDELGVMTTPAIIINGEALWL